jgi:hypothetical protein
MIDFGFVLADKFPQAQWTLDGDDYEGLEWLDDTPKPTKKALEDAWPEVQQARAIAQVERARQAAYAVQADPLFFQYQRGEVTEQEWLDAVQAVKTAHPYPVAS